MLIILEKETFWDPNTKNEAIKNSIMNLNTETWSLKIFNIKENNL